MAVHPKISLLGGVILGAVSLVLILFLLGRQTSGMDLGSLLGGVAVGLLILTSLGIAVVRHLPSSKRLEGILHQSSQPAEAGYISALPRTELLGKAGVALSELRPVGIADIGGERVDVTTEGEWVPSGTPVTVVRAEPMRVVVRRIAQIPA